MSSNVERQLHEPDWLRRLPLVLWLGLAVALSVKAWVEPYEHTTYPCFEAGSRCWWTDANLYDPGVTGHEYRYTPTFAVVLSPLAALPTQWGGMLWAWINVGVLYWALKRVAPGLLPGTWTAGPVAAWHLLVFLASVRGIWSGQSNMLVIALVLAGARDVARGRWGWAAAFLVAPAFIKVWPIAAAMLFAACWPRQLVWRMLLAGLVLAAVPFATRPPGIVWSHLVEFAAGLTGPMQERHVYRDAWTVWELAAPVSPTGYRLLQLAAAALALGLCLWKKRSSGGELALFVTGTWTVWQLVFGPGVERNTLCLIAPLTAWAVLHTAQTGKARWLAWPAYGLVVAFSFGALERALVAEVPAVLGALPVGVLIFGAWLVVAFRDRLRADESGAFMESTALARLRDAPRQWA